MPTLLRSRPLARRVRGGAARCAALLGLALLGASLPGCMADLGEASPAPSPRADQGLAPDLGGGALSDLGGALPPDLAPSSDLGRSADQGAPDPGDARVPDGPDATADGGLPLDEGVLTDLGGSDDASGPDDGGGATDAGEGDGGLADDATVCHGICPGEAPLAERQAGVCAGSLRRCDPERCLWVEPAPDQIAGYELTETFCDGVDNDCDGATDEDLAAPLGTEQRGLCTGSLQRCAGEAGWVEPTLAELVGYEPQETLCDGRDNDCDGATDEELVAALGAEQRGVCAGSLQRCAGEAGWEEPTLAELAGYEAQETLCDGRDNDCDGDTDEGLQAPLASEQRGVCAGARQVCTGEGGWAEPALAALAGYEAQETLCDGSDNDCDGDTDEDLVAPLASEQRGVCAGSVLRCAGAAGWQEPTAAEIEGYESPETLCDGRDNDCDGAVDPMLFEPDRVAACRPRGICQVATLTCAALPSDPPRCVQGGAVPERCNGLDDDCDGSLPAVERDQDGDGLPQCRGDCNDHDPAIHPESTADASWGAGPLPALLAPLDLCADGADWDCSEAGDGSEVASACPGLSLGARGAATLTLATDGGALWVPHWDLDHASDGGLWQLLLDGRGEPRALETELLPGSRSLAGAAEQPGAGAVAVVDPARHGLWLVERGPEAGELLGAAFLAWPPLLRGLELERVVLAPRPDRPDALVAAGPERSAWLDPATDEGASLTLGGTGPHLLASLPAADVFAVAATGGDGGAQGWPLELHRSTNGSRTASTVVDRAPALLGIGDGQGGAPLVFCADAAGRVLRWQAPEAPQELVPARGEAWRDLAPAVLGPYLLLLDARSLSVRALDDGQELRRVALDRVLLDGRSQALPASLSPRKVVLRASAAGKAVVYVLLVDEGRHGGSLLIWLGWS